MVRTYDKTKRYNERDAILHLLEINNEILSELIKMNKLIKKGKMMEKSPHRPKDKKVTL